MSIFIRLVFGLTLLFGVGSADAAPAPLQDCGGQDQADAIAAFRKGLAAFEKKKWPEAIRQLSCAAASDYQEVTWVPLYGRWRYRFEPHIFLGLALSHLAECFTDCSSHCSAVDQQSADPPPGAGQACTADWGAKHRQSFKDSAVDRTRCWRGRCVELSAVASKRFFPAALACPAVDWFILLRQSGFPLGADCEEVSTPDESFWQALNSSVGEHQLVCEEMLEELDSVIELCTEKPQ